MMSEELLIFRKRLQYLDKVLMQLKKTENTKKHDLQTPEKCLKSLLNCVQNAQTLNTGGHFEWVDSKIVKSFKQGQYISLEHVNLCSSAILDRLNPIFEPNGSLMLSEKGVSINNEPEIVKKHKDFRAFLTLDPKNGEISRAMRNRCIEISINKELYTNDNLKQIIYVNGVHDMNMINCLLTIHLQCKSVSDFSHFGISHVCKCANLTGENRRMGYTNDQAIFVSALEVYVRSANTDLLGFGLGYYRNKLKQVIVDEVKQLQTKQIFINFENMIINSSNLNALSLVRIQCEPFIAVIRCCLKNNSISGVLNNLLSGFATMHLESLELSLTNYLLYILYESSSYADTEQRDIYLSKVFQDLQSPSNENSELLSKLQILNKKLAGDIKKWHGFDNSINKQLPWNTNMYPRLLPHYKGNALSINHQLKLSALLIANISLNDIQTKNTTKFSQIDAITYSKAIQTKIVQDSVNNDLITFLYPFLAHVQENVQSILASNTSQMDFDNYVQIICGYLWYNRMQNIAQLQLFNNKTINDTIIDNLTLHYKWMDKHFLKQLTQIDADQRQLVNSTPFNKYHQKLANFVLTNYHPLNLTRKMYVKNLTNFLPYYEQEQINVHEMIQHFSHRTILVPKLGAAFEHEELIKRINLIMNIKCQEFKLHLVDASLNELNSVRLDEMDKPALTDTFVNLIGSIDIFFDKIQALNNNTEQLSTEIDLNCDKEKFDECITNNTTDIKSLKLIVEMLPMQEYFALKSFNTINGGTADSIHQLNLEYFNQIQTIGINELQVLKTINSDAYKACTFLWQKVIHNLIHIIYKDGKTDQFSVLIESLPKDFYRNYSSFDRNLLLKLQTFRLNSMSTQNELCFHLNNDTKSMSSIGSIFTACALSTLFDKSGQLKATGLGDLDIWRNSLATLSQLVWNNGDLLRKEYSFE